MNFVGLDTQKSLRFLKQLSGLISQKGSDSMSNASTPQRPGIFELVATYQAREPKYSGAELDERRKGFREGYAVNRSEGAARISELDAQIADLRNTGRITDSEYFRLCELNAQAERPLHEAPHPAG
jgi:hypothetical protein